MKKYDYYSLSFSGRRENNQDACLIYKTTGNSIFLAVADGMGGVAGGQVASKVVLEIAQNYLKERFNEDVTPDQLKEILIRIFGLSQKALARKINENPGLSGMGTTLTCVLILDNKFVWGNIGDSRTYYYSDSNLNQISVDHTHIQEYKETVANDVSEDIIQNYSHYLTRSLDGENDEPDIFPDVIHYEILEEGDAFLLCSDGLIVNKSSGQESLYKNYLIGTSTLKEAAENLISSAYENGSKDNISVILCSYGKIKKKKLKIKRYPYPPTAKKKEKKKLLFRKWYFWLFILLVAAITIIWYSNIISLK